MAYDQLGLPLVDLRPHLRMIRELPAGERRPAAPGRGTKVVYEDRPAHASRLRASLSQLRAIHARRQPTYGVAPESVVVLHYNRPPDDTALRAAQLQVLDRFDRRIVVTSVQDPGLVHFRARLDRYANPAANATGDLSEETPGGSPPDSGTGTPTAELDSEPDSDLSDVRLPKTAEYKELFDAIDEIREYGQSEVLTAELNTLVAELGNNSVHIDIQCWCPEEDSDARRRNEEVRNAVTTAGGEVRGFTVRSATGLSLIRALLPADKIRDLADVDHVRSIFPLPNPSLSFAQVFSRRSEELPLIIPPAADAPIVAIVDSGVRDGHPLISPALVGSSSAQSLADSSQFHNHGTFVASLALYGSLESALDAPPLQPAARLLSMRVLDENGHFSEESLWETDLLEALDTAAEQGAKIINVSIGDSRRPYQGPRPTPLAAAIDEFIRRTGTLVILSAGNTAPNEYPDGVDPDGYLRHLLDSPYAGLLDPATAALALTVGGTGTDTGQGVHPARANIDVTPVGKPGWPSPVTRRGPGIGGMIKPDLAAPSGSFGFDSMTGKFTLDPTVQVVGANGWPAERVLARDVGTSLAAPLVTNVAAHTLAANPGLTGTGIRALILASAVPTPNIHEADAKKAKSRNEQYQFTGFGRADAQRASSSTDYRTVLLAEASMPVNSVHLYSAKVPSSFFESGGWRILTVALAFDPPVRPTRLDYLGCRMAVTAYRGVDLDEAAAAYIKMSEGSEIAARGEAENDLPDVDELSDDPISISDRRVTLSPSTTRRGMGANQVGSTTMSQRLNSEAGEEWLFAVKNTNHWMEEDAQQPYALVVALERQEGHGVIYEELRNSVRQVIQVDARIELDN